MLNIDTICNVYDIITSKQCPANYGSYDRNNEGREGLFNKFTSTNSLYSQYQPKVNSQISS